MSDITIACLGLALVILGALFSAGAHLVVQLRSARSEVRWLRSAHRHAREQLREAKQARDRYKILAERLVAERTETLENGGVQ